MNIELSALKNKKVVVIGDLMLDTYHIGEVKRISPEAPVPIVRVTKSYNVLGGAANVARNLLGLGAAAHVIGLIGDDNNGTIIKELFSEFSIKTDIDISEQPTITKTRIIGNNQQITRMDFEDVDVELSLKNQDFIINALERAIPNADAVVISDYNKGLCSNLICKSVIECCKKYNKIVIVDPKGTNWDKYKGASLITPNLKELADISGDKISNTDQIIHTAAKGVLDRYNLEAILVTRSEKGISYISADTTEDMPTEAKEVFDVSGAGDTVIATLAASLAAEFPLFSAIKIANIAAGIVVGKIGTSPILFDELNAKLSYTDANSKVVSINNIANITKELRSKGKKVVFTNGCFDILHKGHVTYLERAKSHGDILILGLNSDASVKRLKGENRPINNEDARATVLAALSCIDYVVVFEEDTPLNLIKEVKPNILAKGGDYKIEDIVGREYAEQTITIPFVEGHSTTQTINKMESLS